jgi:DNA-binding transcriptional ArsR family regulator
MAGDTDISVPAALLSNPSRARVLLALVDGRALPASVLALEAGVAPSTASEHLAKLCEAGFLVSEVQGRHRYYRIGSSRVVAAVEALAGLAPTVPIRSLRQGTRANALRRGRLCYDHLAGRVGVELMRAMLERDVLTGGDGTYDPDSAPTDRLAAPGHDVDYRLTDSGADLLTHLGVDVDALCGGRRPLIRYCLDWTEQRHHLAGAVGAAVTARLLQLGWLVRTPQPRTVRVTDEGASGLADTFGMAREAYDVAQEKGSAVGPVRVARGAGV